MREKQHDLKSKSCCQNENKIGNDITIDILKKINWGILCIVISCDYAWEYVLLALSQLLRCCDARLGPSLTGVPVGYPYPPLSEEMSLSLLEVVSVVCPINISSSGG
jgi:hypothetical protein